MAELAHRLIVLFFNSCKYNTDPPLPFIGLCAATSFILALLYFYLLDLPDFYMLSSLIVSGE